MIKETWNSAESPHYIPLTLVEISSCIKEKSEKLCVKIFLKMEFYLILGLYSFPTAPRGWQPTIKNKIQY